MTSDPGWGWNFNWLAVDEKGHVGSFMTDGYGPVPEAFAGQLEALEAADDSEVAFVGPLGPSDRALRVGHLQSPEHDAERGFFCFEWVPDHGPLAAGRYRRVEVPNRAITVDSLPKPIQDLARTVRLAMDFEVTSEFDFWALDVPGVPRGTSRTLTGSLRHRPEGRRTLPGADVSGLGRRQRRCR